MPIVSNTSPILNLAIIGELQLLRAQFGEILIPEAVLKELRADEDLPGSHAISEALNESWIQTSQLKQRSLAISLQRDIDKGRTTGPRIARIGHGGDEVTGFTEYLPTLSAVFVTYQL